MAKWIFLNNAFVAEEQGLLSFKDLSFQRGYGIFDFFKVNENVPLFLEDHLDRFFSSAREMRILPSLTREELKIVILTLLEKNNLPFSGVRLSLTGGLAEDGFSIGNPTLLVSQQLLFPPTGDQVANGIKLFTYAYQRQLPQVKTIDYLTAIWLQPKRLEKGADDILYHHNDLVTECPRSNFFLVTADNKIVTPSENVLAGVTRKKVLQIARKNFAVEERAVSLSEILTAKEAFITSTIKQILPLSQIDDMVLPERTIGLQLLREFRALCLEEQTHKQPLPVEQVNVAI